MISANILCGYSRGGKFRKILLPTPIANVIQSLPVYEACPIPSVDAMSMGCPVVTANRYCTRDVVGDCAVLVDFESVASISNRILCVWRHPELLKDLIDEELARPKFLSWNLAAKETLAFFEQMHAQSGA